MIEERLSKNIKKRWIIKPPPGIEKKDCSLTQYKISFTERGTLLAPRLDAAVEIHYLSKDKKFYVQELSGPSTELYNFLILNSRNRDMFIRTWQQAKGRYHRLNKTMFPQASSGEKLSQKLTEDGMTPKKFAEKTKKDYTQVFRELRGTRPLSLKQGIEYSKELDCDPVDLLFDDLRCNVWGSVNLYDIRELGNDKFFPCQINPVIDKTTVVPRSIYKPNIMAIKVNSPGSWLHSQTAFYYRTNIEEETHNGKLVVAKTRDEKLAEIDIELDMYWFGIYNIEKGGKQQIYNPDRNAEKQLITSGPFEFIAPVVSLVHPTAMQKDYDYYQLNNRAAAIHKHQVYQEKIKEQQMQISQLINDQATKIAESAEVKFDDTGKHLKEQAAAQKSLQEDIDNLNKVLKGLYKEQEEDFEIPDFVKKIA